MSSHVISGLLGGVSYQVMVKSYSASGKRSPAVLRDGVPLLAEECRTEAEPGFWRQVLDPATGVCVGAPERFRLEVGDGEGELQLRGGWFVGFSPEPVSDYVVRWRRSGSSDSWSETVADQGGGVLYKDRPFFLDYGIISFHDPSYDLSWAGSVEGVHIIEGLVDHVLYDVEVEARNVAGSSPVAEGRGSPCPDPMSYVAIAGVCGASPVPEGVEVVSGDRSLTVSWRQDASLLPAYYDVHLYSTISTRKRVVAGGSLSWREGAVEVVDGKEFRTWSYTFTHEISLSAVAPSAPSAVRLTNGRAYRVGVQGLNLGFVGETVFVVARPCADCEEVSRPAVPAAPLVCSGGGVPVAGFCVSPCPQGRFRLGNSLNCSTPAPPTMTSFWDVETFPGARHGTIDLRWVKASFISRGLPITEYVVRWRRLGGAFTGWSSASSPPMHPEADIWGFRIRGLAVGARYQVGVAAVNAAGTSRFDYETVKAACGRGYTHVEGTGFCILPPHPPQAFTASPSGAGAVKVAWEQADWDNYHPVTGYQLRWRPAGSSTPWKTEEVPWTDGKPATAAGDPRMEFTHTITGLAGATATAGARLEIQVAADNEIPDNQSAWVSTAAVTCPTGQARLSAAAGCTALPALPTDATAEAPTLTLHPTTGGITAAWWQRTAAFNPDTYKLEWKKTGAAAFTPSAALTPAGVNVPLPSSYTGWTLNARHIPNLDMCTHDVRVTAAKGAQERMSNTASGAPGGTVTVPGAPREGFVANGSAGGDQLYVYWKRPECDGGSPLSEYKVTYKLDSDSTWTDAATMTSTGELARMHNGYRIGGLAQGTEYDVRVTVKNNRNLTRAISLSGEPEQVDEPKVDQDFEEYVWRPYRMPLDKFALVNEKIMLGQAVLVCTSVAEFEDPLTEAAEAWNAALADNKLKTPTPRSEDAPAGKFEFSGTASTPADCGEISPHSFDVVVMDYRTTCPATSSTCADTSCALAAPLTETANNCAYAAGCPLATGSDPDGCLNFYPGSSIGGGDLLPRSVQNSSGTVHVINLTDRLLRHELGHNLYLVDYGAGCHWISEDTTESSLMSYGSNQDWRDYQRIVNTQNSEAANCRSETITERDKEDLHAIYHPAAFGSLSIGAIPSPTPGQPGKEHFVVGSPPQDLDGNDYYNAYRYVILHRAPKGTNGNPNAFMQLMNGTNPVVFTPEDVEDAVDNSNSMLTSIDLKASSIAALMKKGHEFVFVGVTRGDPQRDPGKSLNPVSAAGLAHAVMTLNLGPNSGLAGEHKWTLGTPVLYIHQ